MDIEIFKMRLELVRDAASRARGVFAATTVASVTLITATFNLMGSWVRLVPLSSQPFPANEVVAELWRGVLKGWVDSQFVTIPLLGIKFNVADASVLGSAILAIFSIWLFYCMRRENHLIGQVLTEVSECDAATRQYVYLGISGTQIFATVSDDDSPFEGLGDREKHAPTLKGTFLWLVRLPAAATILLVASDIATLFLPSAFRYPHVPVYSLALKDPGMLGEIGVRILFSMIFGFICCVHLENARRYQDGTVKFLRSVASWAKSPQIVPQASAAPIPKKRGFFGLTAKSKV